MDKNFEVVDTLGFNVELDARVASESLKSLSDQAKSLKRTLLGLTTKGNNAGIIDEASGKTVADLLNRMSKLQIVLKDLSKNGKVSSDELVKSLGRIVHEYSQIENAATVINGKIKQQTSGIYDQNTELAKQKVIKNSIVELDSKALSSLRTKLSLEQETLKNAQAKNQNDSHSTTIAKAKTKIAELNKSIEAEELTIINNKIKAQEKLNKTGLQSKANEFNKEVLNNSKQLATQIKANDSAFVQYLDTVQKTSVKTKSVIEEMTKSNPLLTDMAKYYSNQEKTFKGSADKYIDTVQKTSVKTKSVIEEMTKSNPLLTDMAKYYTNLEKLDAKSVEETRKSTNVKRTIHEQYSNHIAKLEAKLAGESRPIWQKMYSEQISLAKANTVQNKEELNKLLLSFTTARDKAAEAQRVMARSMSGVTDSSTGTTFGHKFLTTAQYMAAGTALMGVATAAGAVGKNFLEADLQMRTLAAVLKTNTTQAQALSSSIRELGQTYGGSLQEIEGVAISLARAGIASKDMVSATTVVLQMARLTGDTFAESANAIISFQQVFGNTTSIETLGDKLAYIANVSRLSTQDIGTFSNYALAAAKAVGMTEDAVGGLAAAFSNAGVNASTIGTEIRTFTGILTSSATDVKDFFLGIGVNQKDFAAKVQQGGKVSNDAILDFVNILGTLDSTTFNQITGNMDKLTTNVLALMRNNKGNIEEFTKDLEDGAKGQLKAVDIIIEAHQVKLERYWNTALNGAQEFLTAMEGGLSAVNLAQDIADIEGELKGDLLGFFTPSGDEKKALEDKLATLKAIQGIKLRENTLIEINAKLEKAVGADWTTLYDAKKTLLKGIEHEKSIIAGNDKTRSEEEIAQLKKAKEEKLASEKAELARLEGLDKQSAAYIFQKKVVAELEDDVKKLNDTVGELKSRTLEGLDFESLGKSLKKTISEGFIPDDATIATFNDITERAIKNLDEAKQRAFTNSKADVEAVKALIGENGELNEAYRVAGELTETNKILIAEKTALQKDQGELTKEENQRLVDQKTATIESNNEFISLVGQLFNLSNARKTITAEQQAITDETNKQLAKQADLTNQLAVAEAKKAAAKSGKTGSNLIGAEIDALKEQLKVAQDAANASGGAYKDVTKYQELAIKLSNKETEQIVASNAERERGAKSAERAEERATKKVLEALDIKTKTEIAQAELNGKALTQYEIAKKIQQVEYAKVREQEALGKFADANLTKALADLDYRKAITDEVQKEADLKVAIWKASQLNQGIIPTEAASLSKTILTQEEAIVKAKQEGANVAELELKLQELKNTAKQTEIERTREIAEIYRQMNLDNLQAQSQLITNSVNYNANLTGSAAEAQKLAQTLVSASEKETQYIIEKSNLDKKYQEESEKYKDNSESSVKALAALTAQKANAQANLDKQYQQNQILGYANIAGAMSGMFEQGSKDAQNFQRIQAALAMVAGIQAILTQGQGDPYSAMPRMLAMAGMVVSVLANAKIAFGGIGGVKTTTSSDSLSSMKANTGTGTVLGDTEAQSDSIRKSLDILQDYAKPEYQLLNSMNKYLSHIASGIGGVSSLLIQEGGYAFGQGFQSTDSGWKGKISDSQAKNTSAVLTGGTSLITDKLTGGLSTKLVGSAINGIFGKTSVSSKMKDSGMYFADQLLTEATKNFVGSAYQTVETTTTKKSWFSKSTDTSSKTSTQGLSAQTNRQFTMVIDNLYKTTLLAGEALDTATSTVEDRLKNFIVSIGKISLYKKSGDEIQKTLEAIFGRLGDQIAVSAFPLLKGFQGIGEGMFETMTRVATGMEEAEYYIERLGYQFRDLPYWEVINKSGNVGFEVLLQSIIKTDEGLYGLNNNLVQVIGSLDSTAEELYGAYTILDGLRDRLKFLNHNINGLSFGMIKGAGSIDALQSGFEAFFEGFLTDTEQLSYITSVMSKEFNKLNLALPVSKDAFKALLAGIDLTTTAGQELYGRLIILSEGFAEVADAVAESIKALEEQLLDKGTQAFEDFNTALEKVFKSVQSMITKTKNLINSITEKTTEDDLYTRLVKYNKLFDEFALTSSEETYDAILALSQSLADDSDVAPSVLKRLDSVLGSLTEKEQVLRVNIVDGLGELLGLNQEQLQQLQTSVSDGKLTNTELTSINGLTQVQKDGIVSFAEKSSTFSTEDTLSSLELYAQQQLALFKQDIEKEKVGMSGTTFKYGDYVGLQEQIDIAKTLGVSYGTAKPMVESLQALSISTNLKKDLSSLIGYNGYEFDVTKVSQIEKLGANLSPEIIQMLNSIKAESTNNVTNRNAFEASKSEFMARLATAESNLQSYNNALGGAHSSAAYWDKKVEDTDNGSPNYKKYKANRKAAWEDINKYTALVNNTQDLIATLYNEKALKGYSAGGYTGNGGMYDVAGLVHKGEYVLSQNDLRNVGGRASVEAFINGKASNITINLDPVVQEIKSLKEENQYMKQLLVKIAADGTKALSTQRGILDAVSPEEGV